jgi:hypothetical protein
MRTTTKTIAVVCTFSIAMAALESAVVVYLRALYYPGEFTVAFKLIDQRIIAIEIAREIATIIMLASVACLAGRTFKDRLAWFFMSFAVWDIFYYLWLKVFIDWPVSVLDWDILFLIPFTWLGPVLAPLICSLTMVVLALVLLARQKPVSSAVWALLTGGSLFILYTFMRDYGWLIIGNGFLADFAGILQNKEFLELAAGYAPKAFAWTIFAIGEILISAGIVLQFSGRILPGKFSSPQRR